MQRAVLESDFAKSVAVIKHETNDECLGGVSTTMALGIRSIVRNSFASNDELLDCVVCGDRATGNY